MEKEIESVERETYIAPDIEVIEIEIEQNLLAGGSGEAPNLVGEDW